MATAGYVQRRSCTALVALISAALLGTAACGGVEAPPPGPDNPLPPPPVSEVPGAPPASPGAPPSSPSTPSSPGTATATYALQSSLDATGALPDPAQNAVNIIAGIAEDPAGFLLDRVIERTDGSLRSALELGRAFAAPAINDWIEDNVPELVNEIRDVVVTVVNTAQQLQFNSTLSLSGQPGAMTGTHTIDAFGAVFRDQSIALPTSLLFGQPVSAQVAARVQGDQLILDEHGLSLAYGQVLVNVVNTFVIPRLQPGASSIGDFLASRISCEGVAQYLNDRWDQIPEDAVAAACDVGLAYAGQWVEDKMASLSLDSFRLAGQARLVDVDGDGNFDQVVDGRWTAKLDIAGNERTLAGEGDAFVGNRAP